MRLIPGQFVKPFRKSNKNDYLDAEAIAEAVPWVTLGEPGSLGHRRHRQITALTASFSGFQCSEGAGADG